MKITEQQTLGEIAATDHRWVEVLQAAGIDFSCGGEKTIATVCAEQKISSAELIGKLHAAASDATRAWQSYQSWPLDLLTDYVEKKHHRYVEAQIPVLNQQLKAQADTHAAQHPELHEVLLVFSKTAGELAMHMKKEELMLFPAIRKMTQAHLRRTEWKPANPQAIAQQVEKMQGEHDDESERFRKIRQLTHHYTAPENTAALQPVYTLLREFENDLHWHLHTENNVLFPRSIALEKEMSTMLQTQAASVQS